jgi:hypothetical protein
MSGRSGHAPPQSFMVTQKIIGGVVRPAWTSRMKSRGSDRDDFALIRELVCVSTLTGLRSRCGLPRSKPCAETPLIYRRASAVRRDLRRTPLSLFHICPPPVFLAARRASAGTLTALLQRCVPRSHYSALATLALFFPTDRAFPGQCHRTAEIASICTAESLAAPVILGSAHPDKAERPNATRRTSYGLYIPRILADAPCIQPACRGLRPPGPPPEKGAAPLWTLPGTACAAGCVVASLSWAPSLGGGIA